MKILTDDGVGTFLHGYRLFKAGFLPDPGGWRQQDHKFISAMRFLQSIWE